MYVYIISRRGLKHMMCHSYFSEIYGSVGVSENGGLHTYVYLSIVFIRFHEHFVIEKNRCFQSSGFADAQFLGQRALCYMVLVIYLHGWAMFGVNGGKYMGNFHMHGTSWHYYLDRGMPNHEQKMIVAAEVRTTNLSIDTSSVLGM